MHIGSPLIYIGGGWFSGSWQSPSTNSDSSFINQGGEGDWIFYDANTDEVIRELSFDSLLSEGSAFEEIAAEYRGYNPIVVQGFFITSVPERLYLGGASAMLDKERIIEWADLYTKGGLPPGTPGLEVQFIDFDTLGLEIKQFKTGEGDSRGTPISYTGHENSIVRRGDRLNFGLRITVPSNADREILSALHVHFGVDIAFIEIPYNLSSAAEGDEC